MIKDIYEIQFPELGWKFHIDPTAFTIAGIDIQWYALIIISGLLLAMLYCFPRMKKFGVDSDKAIDAVIGGVIGGIIGARIYYVLMNLKDYKKDTFSASLLACDKYPQRRTCHIRRNYRCGNSRTDNMQNQKNKNSSDA